MKKYLRKYMFICVGILLVVLIGYVTLNNQLNETISISYDSKIVDLKPLHYRNEPFKVFFESYDSIPEIPTDINLLIDFNDVVVDEIEILEYILDDQGHLRYTEKEIRTLPMQVINNDYFITLDEHPAMYLSSLMADYINHGIEMIITGNGQTKSYLFVFKSPSGDLVSEEVIKEETSITDNGFPFILQLGLQGLIDADVALNNEMSYIAIDYTEIEGVSETIKDNISTYLSTYQIPILEETFDSLKAQNLFIDNDYLDGILLKISMIEYISDDEVHLKGSKYKSTLGAIGYEFTLRKVDGIWQITISTITWIS